MKNYYFTIFIFCISKLLISCSNGDSDSEFEPIDPDPTQTINPIEIPEYTQRSGDPQKGFEYLTTGDYMSSGIPYDIFILGFGEDNENLLNRTGDNAILPAEYTAVDAPNGVRIVSPNCMQCHSAKINNEFVMGLGSHDYDFTVNREEQIPLVTLAINRIYGANSPEAEAYEILRKSLLAIGSKTVTKTRGSNPADKVTLTLSAYRDKNTLEPLENPQVTVSDEVIPTDVPAWWLLKKKNAMFYHAIGREDFTKYIMALSVLTLKDNEKADEIDKNFEDVLAYIYSIEPPKYPFNINNNLANQGKIIFEDRCSSCHGTYGDNDTYPNLLFPLEIIGTDSALSNQYTGNSDINNYFLDWANTGWFGSGSNGLNVLPEGGYIAPPLDGVWATAPYLHNGSVPTIEDLLNSSQRPTYWSRTFNNADYNQNKVGWNYTVENSKVDKNTYDTSLFAHGNKGHTFGDTLSDEDRKAVIEYLKTL